MSAGRIFDLYRGRRFTDGYLNLEELGVEYFSKNQQDSSGNIECILRCIGRMIDLGHGLNTVCESGIRESNNLLRPARLLGATNSAL